MNASQPRCAVCVAPIQKNEEFVLGGTEVFHLRCVKARGTAASVGNRRKARLVELQGENAQLRTDLEYARGQLERLGRDDRRHELEREVSRLKLQLADLAEREEEYRRTRTEARRERDIANLALDTATREIALLRTLGPSRTSTPTPTEQADPAPQDDGKDATEKRFSLLELD